VLEKWSKAKIALLLCAGHEAPMPRAQGCAGAAELKKPTDGLFQNLLDKKELPLQMSVLDLNA